jgi:hypothetical protein
MTTQLALEFTPGLAQRYRNLKACMRDCIYGNVKPLKSLAADMDLSESELSRKLSENPDDPRRFSIDDLEAYIAASGDVTPIYYLSEKFAVSTEAKQAYAAAELVKVLPQLLALAEQAGIAPAPKGRK